MATSTLPVLSRTSLAQMIMEDDFLVALLVVGNVFEVKKIMLARLREQGLYTVKIATVYSVVQNLAGRKTIFDHLA